ncbi:MAG TPA: hypothetical protein VF327_01370, partial [Gaiellaceae bacterium]
MSTPRLLIRDLAQLATPASGAAPVRGPSLGAVEVLEDAYVLCAGDTIEAVGRMRDLPPLDGDVVELDGRGRCAIPGLVDCHTHPAFGGNRVDEFSLRAGGASYEELHAAGGGIQSTVRATRAAGGRGERVLITRVDVAHDTGAGVGRQHTLEPLRRLGGAVGDHDHAGMDR